MQKLAEICIRRPVFAAMLILALVVVGIAAYRQLGVDRFPAVDIPQVRVRAVLPGAAPEEMETEVAQRLEEAVNTVEGLDELRSISGAGATFLAANFALERDVDVAAQDVRDRVSAALIDLPPGIEPPIVAKFDNESSPVLTVALSADRPLRELTDFAQRVVKVQLERARGVGEVTVVGGLERAINVWVDADRLAAFGLPITAIRDAVLRQHSQVPGGNVTTATREASLRTLGRLDDPAAFAELVLATRDGTPIRVRDVGRAEDGTKEQRSVARLDDVPTVILEVRRQSGANTVAVIEAAKANLEALAPRLPPDVRVQIIRDQSRYIHAALHEITVHLVLGSALACLVVLAFMRSWRSTVIAGVAIPASVIATFAVMWALGFTLNSVTMLALVLMVGIVIDDAIVVLENIFRFVEEKRMPAMAAARAATAEIGLAVTATTLSLVVVFVPVSFMSSISGRFLYQFGITAAAAVLVSLLVSFTLTPTMSARLLRGGDAPDRAQSRTGFYARLDAAYARALAWALGRRRPVALLAGAIVLSSVPLYGLIRQEYIPTDVDEAEFDVWVSAPEGTSVGAMDEAMRAIAADIRATPGVRTVLATAGGGFLGSVNAGYAYVRIAPHAERYVTPRRILGGLLRLDPGAAFRGNFTQRDVMQRLRATFRKYPDLRISVRNAPSFNLGGAPVDIDFNIRGPDLTVLADAGERLRARMLEMGGIADADTTLKLDKPELRVVVDRDRAADLGVEVEDVAMAMRLMVGGDDRVSRFVDPSVNEAYDVQVRLEERDRTDPGAIARLYVPRTTGDGLVRLDSVARLDPGATASRIDRLDRQRVASVRGTVAPGYALADRLAAVRAAVAELGLPPAYTTSVSGRGRELERTFGEFIWAFLLGIAFMYMILAAQYESLIDPVTILLSLPLAVPFALLSLWLAGNTLNLYSALGILVLFGVVKKNSILQIDHIKQLRAGGLDRTAAILRGSRDRLRPILMTTLTLVAGMLPLALGTGPGAEERRTIAVVVIGGQSLSLLLTLVVTPVAYSLFDDAWAALRARRGANAPRPAPPARLRGEAGPVRDAR